MWLFIAGIVADPPIGLQTPLYPFNYCDCLLSIRMPLPSYGTEFRLTTPICLKFYVPLVKKEIPRR